MSGPSPAPDSGAAASRVVVTDEGAAVRLSPSAWRLLEAVRSGISFETLAEALSRRQGKPITAAELEAAHRRLVEGLRQARLRSRRALPPGFWLRLPLLSAALVGRFAALLRWLFDGRWAAALLLGCAAVFTALAATQGAAALRPGWDAATLWPAYGLFLLSLLAHELGHAAACARHGVAPREIGFTVYLIYPALYSDVTAAWQLPRKERVIVDLGGVYFQLLAAAVYAASWLVLGASAEAAAALSTALWMILASCLFSLNPVFRFDGYWMLADALGVDRLDDTPRRLLGRLAARLRGRPIAPLPWPPRVVAVLALYAPLAVIVWALFLARVIPALLERAVALPGQVTLALRVVMGAHSAAPGLAAVAHELLVSVALLGFSGLVVWQLLRRLARLVLPGRGRPDETVRAR